MMKILPKFTIIMLIVGFTFHGYALDDAHVIAFHANQCKLAEHYYVLADPSKNVDRSEAIGWLESASTSCPSYQYFMELGMLLMESSKDYEHTAAHAAFASARNNAKTEYQGAESLYQRAQLSIRNDELQNAKIFVDLAMEMNSENQFLNELANTIEERLLHKEAPELTRAPGGHYDWPPEDPSTRQVISSLPGFESVFSEGMKFSEIEAIFRNAFITDNYVYEYRIYAISKNDSIFDVIVDPNIGNIEDIGLCTDEYFDLFYPSGFVIVTQIEGIDKDGVPLQGKDRNLPPLNARSNSLFSKFTNLFTYQDDHYYRYIAFVVIDEVIIPSDRILSEETARGRLKGKCTELPPKFGMQEYSKDHKVEALIYEYAWKKSVVDHLRVGEGGHGWNVHLEKSGLRAKLLQRSEER